MKHWEIEVQTSRIHCLEGNEILNGKTNKYLARNYYYLKTKEFKYYITGIGIFIYLTLSRYNPIAAILHWIFQQ